MKKGDKGENVKVLQRALLDLGYGLPRWGVDGDFGEETISALDMVLASRSYVFTGTPYPDKAISFVLTLRDRIRQEAIPLPLGYIDRRMHALRKHDYGVRPWTSVTGICLHQTACNMGENPPRYDAIGAHFVVTRLGKILHMHDMDRLIVHGNGFNTRTVGIEFDGLYAGVQGDPKTVWDDPETSRHEVGQDVTDQAVSAGQQLLRWICAEVRRRGGKVSVLVAHRQASENRRNDPGSEIWQRVALPMHEQLVLTDGGSGFKIGSGYPIPEAWDPSRVGTKY